MPDKLPHASAPETLIKDNCVSSDSPVGILGFIKHRYKIKYQNSPWWRHPMETLSALLAICVGNSAVPGEFPTQRPVTRSFDVFFDLRLNKRLRKQSWCWWFETLSRPSWRHCNAFRSCANIYFHFRTRLMSWSHIACGVCVAAVRQP